LSVHPSAAFNPKENVRLKDETTISLASYAARMEIQLLKASDFNEKFESGAVQKESRFRKYVKWLKMRKRSVSF